MFENFPVFSLEKVLKDCQGQMLFGQLSSTIHYDQEWIGDIYLGYLTDSTRFYYGRWFKVEGGWNFRLDEPTDELTEGENYIAIDGYWGQRVEHLFLPFTWSQATYIPSSDPYCHDHCYYCWATISIRVNTEHWESNAEEVACNDCYEKYVKPKSIDFICAPGGKQ